MKRRKNHAYDASEKTSIDGVTRNYAHKNGDMRAKKKRNEDLLERNAGRRALKNKHDVNGRRLSKT